ncbi:hypothetical protein GLOIN_2v1599061 [Rhizophagus clarus]|uniref:Uncharacterized protein n=1 Tax=Rhizophagus clarus TaxID=94130 RepID=A0A8H3QX80_9GLOM|nr:hypothetical protein GLOIN_2v1599061 [Rhizophagus clarus]
MSSSCFYEIGSANTYHNVTDYHRTHEPSTTLKETSSTPTESQSLYTDSSIKIPFDKCSEFGVIINCTSTKPYCFVDGDNIFCGPTDRLGWRISPLDGLILNDGQKPDSNCELFKPPENLEIKSIIMNLLNYSEFGSGFKGRESAWFNIFEYLGNCPLKTQYCDKDLLICQNLLGAGKNCTSSNQCLSHFCEKYDENAPDDTAERRCIEVDDTNNSDSLGKKTDNKDSGHLGKGSLLIIISISVGSSILILAMILFLIKARRKKHLISSKKFFPNNDYLLNDTTININQPGFVEKHFSSFSSLPSSLLSRISSTISRPYSKNVKRDSSDHFSVLLPPPPTFNRDMGISNQFSLQSLIGPMLFPVLFPTKAPISRSLICQY